VQQLLAVPKKEDCQLCTQFTSLYECYMLNVETVKFYSFNVKFSMFFGSGVEMFMPLTPDAGDGQEYREASMTIGGDEQIQLREIWSIQIIRWRLLGLIVFLKSAVSCHCIHVESLTYAS